MTLSPTPVIAAFDLDGTLSDGGSVFKWLRFLCGTRATYSSALRLAGPILVGALRSGPWADEAKERLLLRLLAGRPDEDVHDASRVFALAHFEEHGRPRVTQRLEWHLRQGHDVVIVSASPQIYVEVLAEHLNAAAGIGTRLAVDPLGKLTGGYLGKNCRGREKLRRLNEWIESTHPGVPPVIFAYGNSRGDRRMLRAATYPYDVGKLGPLGALRHFPRLKSKETQTGIIADE